MSIGVTCFLKFLKSLITIESLFSRFKVYSILPGNMVIALHRHLSLGYRYCIYLLNFVISAVQVIWLFSLLHKSKISWDKWNSLKWVLLHHHQIKLTATQSWVLMILLKPAYKAWQSPLSPAFTIAHCVVVGLWRLLQILDGWSFSLALLGSLMLNTGD